MIETVASQTNQAQDVTSLYTAFTSAVIDANETRKVAIAIHFDHLDTEPGEIYVLVTVGGYVSYPPTGYYQHGDSATERIITKDFIVPANETVVVQILSENSANSSVDADLSIYDVHMVHSGPHLLSLTVDDGSDPVVDAKVRVKKGQASIDGNTDAAGFLPLNVPPGNYDIIITHQDFTYTPSNHTISGDTSLTLSMT